MFASVQKLGKLSTIRLAMSAPFNKPVETEIRRLLTGTFTPSHLDVINESYKHNVPKESEMHFKVVVVSDQFEGKKLIERHRMVNTALHQLLQDKIHALSIEVFGIVVGKLVAVKRPQQIIDVIKSSEVHVAVKTVHGTHNRAKTPTQWQESSVVHPTPPCQGGFGK